jgi:glycosyltransferase involved in cell wall biosynthesis
MQKNILFIHHVSTFSGGAEKYLNDLVSVLDRRYKVFFISQEPGPLSERLNRLGVFLNFQKFPAFRKIRFFLSKWIAVRQLIKFCRSQDIHLICSNCYRVTPYGVIAARVLKIPSITIIHDFVPEKKLKNFYVFDCDLLVTVSKSLSKAWESSFKREIFTIYNGMDVGKFIQEANGQSFREESAIPVRNKIVGMVGNFAPVKNHKLFLEAMKIVAASFSDVTFVIVGDSLGVKNLSLQDLRNEAKKIGLEERVIFTGNRSDVPNLLKSFDILVSPSSHESFGRVVMEAMAMGVAVVATDSGGPGEIIEDGLSGIIIPVDDAPRIAEAVLALLRDDQRRKELGAKGHCRIKKHFSLEKTYFKFNKIFDLNNNSLNKKGIKWEA